MSLFRAQRDPEAIQIVGAPSTPLGDLYLQILRSPWWVDLIAVSVLFLLINLVFAVLYVTVGGVIPTRPTPTLPYPR